MDEFLISLLAGIGMASGNALIVLFFCIICSNYCTFKWVVPVGILRVLEASFLSQYVSICK